MQERRDYILVHSFKLLFCHILETSYSKITPRMIFESMGQDLWGKIIKPEMMAFLFGNCKGGGRESGYFSLHCQAR